MRPHDEVLLGSSEHVAEVPITSNTTITSTIMEAPSCEAFLVAESVEIQSCALTAQEIQLAPEWLGPALLATRQASSMELSPQQSTGKEII